MTRTLVHGAHAVGGGRVPHAWVLFDGDTVAAAGAGRTLPPADHVVDAAGAYLVPGFIDLHCHGGGGRAVDEALDVVVDTHAAHGTTRLVASFVTAPLEELLAQLHAIPDHDGLLGVHLEGPFIARSHCGAHDPSLLRDPHADAVDALIEAAGGRVRQVTIAPELPGALGAIRQLRDHGIAAAVGHTGADYDETRAGFDAGARLLTHAGNGMPELLHRSPGPLGAALADERVTLEVIADGVHVHPALVRLLFSAAPGRIALVTDAMAAAAGPEGEYQLGSQRVVVSRGVARLADGSSIAGSVLTLDAAVRNAVSWGVPLAAALDAVTAVPARVLGAAARFGGLAPGQRADAVLLDEQLRPVAVWRDGQLIAG